MIKLHAENLPEQIAQYLREKIICLELKPGLRLMEAKVAGAGESRDAFFCGQIHQHNFAG